jgi:RNA-directed DNA polymerase
MASPHDRSVNTRRFLATLRDDLKARRFQPDRVRERMIPKANGKLRRLGIPTAADRVVQGALKLVLEPIFEADFKPCSYGFRPNRRAQDAIAEIHMLTSRGYTWVVDADIKACFDEIDHTALMQRCGDASETSASCASSRPSSRPASSARTARRGRRSPAHRKAASSHRCWPTSPSPAWTSTSRTPGKRSDQMETREPPPRRERDHETRPVRRRLRDPRARHPRSRARATRRSQQRSRPDRPTPVGREDQDLPHRRRLRLPRLAHPAPTRRGQAGRKAIYTYPSRKAVTSLMKKVRSLTRRNQHKTLADLLHRSTRCCEAGAPTSARRVHADLQLRRPLHLVAHRRLDPQTTRTTELGHHAPPPHPQLGDRDGDVEMFRPRR